MSAINDVTHDIERLGLSSTRVGDTLFRIGNYSSAKEEYLKVAKSIVGPSSEFPISANGGVISQRYATLTDSQIVDLMGCLNGLAQCERKLGNNTAALLWLEEVHIIYLNLRFSRAGKLYDWTPWFPENVDFTVQYAKARAAAGDIFLELGNTGTTVHRRWTAQEMIPTSHNIREPRILRTILSRGGTKHLISFRHPDPQLVHKITVTDPSLQLLGSWKKMKIKKAGGPGRRMGFSSFIWDDGWKSEPDYPQPMSRTSAFLGWHTLVCPEHKRVYLFTGRPALDFFDLTTKTWGSFTTKFVHSGTSDTRAGIKNWPYPKNQLTDSTQQIVNEKLYVFGGTHGSTSIGCNLFLVLDLKTKEWRRLSGTVMPTKDSDVTVPGPRKTPNGWVDNAKDKFYLLGGECDRMGAALSGEMHGGDCGHPFDDFWSWDLTAEKWTRERLVGNVPAPRSETACIYNPLLNKTILWGGYNPDLPTDYVEQDINFGFSYYADTFIYDGPPASETAQTTSPPTIRRKWQQVITKGFPTYRAQSHLLVDPQSGRTYLFGGFTNNDFVPSRKNAISRSFGDLWELRIDLPGGHFEGVDVEDEVRTAQLGPWQRCFTCGSAGPWRKCGGSCRGRAFFCDAECLKEGWKDHKAAHDCRKL
ncbi:hypothetical protein BDZ97DRAFT_1811635 [Flammula alnicola]|nr:hypothetical protein BDZ97DRAFT_1811635 [Flammula alnicola]